MAERPDGIAISNRIRQWRKRRGLTLQVLAGRLGTSAGHLHKWETGKVSITLDRLGEVATALECNVLDLVEGLANVPVVGRVGAGSEVHAVDDHAMGQGTRHVRCPNGLDAQQTVAVEVVGDSMLPIEEGWLLFYTRDYEGVPTECLGKLCVVQLADDGPRYVKRIKPGRQNGLFNLYSTNAREMEDMALAWAAPVLDARPPVPGEVGAPG
ncbi:MAG: XRE family transcriptional regulator [Defluviicoccus sp.]|nr:XRE family transcriptional regulator [Defluviicoccus sp.]